MERVRCSLPLTDATCESLNTMRMEIKPETGSVTGHL